MLTTSSPRYELKLNVAEQMLDQARGWLRLHPAAFRATFPPRPVNNLYFDSTDLDSWQANLSGISRRQKVRLRWYGPQTPTTSQPVLELKAKENLLGYKKQETLDCTLDWSRPFADLLRTMRAAADPDWFPWLNSAVQPVLINHYRREYYATPDGLLRATLDYRLTAFDQRLSPRPNFTRRSPLESLLIIELKAAPEQSGDLQAAMGHFPLPRRRHSKYVTGTAMSWH